MGYSHRQDFRTSVSLKVDPKVVLCSNLLQLNQAELEMTIESELAENPALERLNDPVEPMADEQIIERVAPRSLKSTGTDYEFERSSSSFAAEETDWQDFAGAEVGLRERLLAELRSNLPQDQANLAMYLVGSLDNRGYLEASPEAIAIEGGFDLDAVTAAIAALRRCQPAGVGAENLRQCLELQLQDEQSLEGKLALQIVRHHFEELLEKNKRPISRRYRVLPEVVEAAFAVIAELNPFPLEAGPGSLGTIQNSFAGAATADLILCREESGWLVEVRGADAQDFAVNRFYQQRLKALKGQAPSERDEKRHLNEFVGRAERFIEVLGMRKATLRRIGMYLIESQAGFVSTGDTKFLRQLTRSKMAKDLNLHESTVSRATAGKFVQLANGEVVSFELFFKPALRVQQLITEILATENPDSPYSDERIAALLAERGVKIARRTVNKYRDKSRMLSSRRRKSA